MENVAQIIMMSFLIIAFLLSVFNFLYRLEVQRVVRKEGFAIPWAVERLLSVNIFLPFFALLLILLFLIAH